MSTVPANAPADTILLPGQTYAGVTDTIADTRAGAQAPAWAWLLGVAACGTLTMLLVTARERTCSLRGVGIWGIDMPVAWGFAIVNFVWWIGIGHAGTFISAFLLLIRPKLADEHQPFRRGDDPFRRRDGRADAHHPPRPALAVLLADPVPQHDVALAAVPQPPRLGRLRRQHLCHCLARLLVHRPRCPTSPRCATGPSEPLRQKALRHPRPRLAQQCPALGAIQASPTSSWPASRRRWLSVSTASSASTSPPPNCPAGIQHDLPALLRRRRDPQRLRDGHHPRRAAPQGVRLRGDDHRTSHLGNCAKLMLVDRPHRQPTAMARRTFSPGFRGRNGRGACRHEPRVRRVCLVQLLR